MNEGIVAGIDGGQTSTTAAVALLDGTIVGRGTGPPADLVGEPRGALARQRAALTTALAAAFHTANLVPAAPLASLVIGLTGHDDGMPAPFALSHAAAEVFVHDTVIAHAGALGGNPGIVVLAGTGSVALGNVAAGCSYVRAGGWGYFFGDDGSALWIAREALALAMSAEDRGESSHLGEAALAFFEAPDLRALQHAFAHGELTRPALAAFAGTALALADAAPNSTASRLRTRAAESLADLVACIDGRLAKWERTESQALKATGASGTRAASSNGFERHVSFAGGVFANEGLRRAFEAQVRIRLPGATVVAPVGDPLSGAIRLATQLARDNAPAFGGLL